MASKRKLRCWRCRKYPFKHAGYDLTYLGVWTKSLEGDSPVTMYRYKCACGYIGWTQHDPKGPAWEALKKYRRSKEDDGSDE